MRYSSAVITRDIIESNRESWRELAFLVALYPNDKIWKEWKAFVSGVLHAGIGCGLDQYFRAGIQMNEIIFSTAERHGLETFKPAPPRVRLMSDEQMRMFVACSHSGALSVPERQDSVTSENVMPVLKTYLAALWRETRPAEPVPQAVTPID